MLFDEFDALAKERADSSEHGELKRVVTAFLQLLDEFHGRSLILAATNHPDLMDDAVWRRFDEVLAFSLPTQHEIELLIKMKLRSTRHRVPLRDRAKAMKGFSHAEVEITCLDACDAQYWAAMASLVRKILRKRPHGWRSDGGRSAARDGRHHGATASSPRCR